MIIDRVARRSGLVLEDVSSQSFAITAGALSENGIVLMGDRRCMAAQ